MIRLLKSHLLLHRLCIKIALPRYIFAVALIAIANLAQAATDAAALSQTCVACHGANGMSANPLWPNLAGQRQGYLISEMQAFRDGTRKDPLMSPMAANLSDGQIEALADYYSSMEPPTPEPAVAVNEDGQRVRALCISCHGKYGKTVNTEWPNLAGQQAQYLQKQLLAFKNDQRKGSLMNVIAKELTDQQIADVAEYYSQIAP
ncbi:MAG: cytochrome c4 [Gammaproteobacteria bacterium]|uniref:c-type cytochrome n=1 Tax=Pseudomaricurvus alcaniphilus TaxID=1166482 RepID=UPI00140E63D7|nr:c-type cytochrome [Pseudomaricurvus alcaniphilus]MBR9910078.1 cytochrome c4 [Gammaproteobacteria bacterium]NHN36594.1 cytochrome c4 [Pseudomaricurvus alcaniphilus]